MTATRAHATPVRHQKARLMTSPGPSPTRKLPKMNGSERAKFYRRRIQNYMANLEATDASLAQIIKNLGLVRHVQGQLMDIPCLCRQQILTEVWEFLDQKRYLEQHIFVRSEFEVNQVAIRGEAGGIILCLETSICGVYSQDTVEKQLYTFIPGNTRLLAALQQTKMIFQGSVRFYFSSEGALVQQTSETDFVDGLMRSISCPFQDIYRLMNALGNPKPIHRKFHQNIVKAPSLRFLDMI